MKIKWVLLLLGWLWWPGQNQAQVADRPFVVDDSFRESALAGYVYVGKTAQNTPTIDALLADTTGRYGFYPTDYDILNLGYDPTPHWLRCRINSEATRTQELVFGIDFAHIDDLAFYVVDDRNRILYRQEQLNRKTPLAQRPLPSHVFAFPVSLKPGQTLTLYCRVFRQHSVLILPVKLLSRSAFLDNGFTFSLVGFSSLGSMLIAFIISFGLFVATRRSILLYYSIYVISLLILFLSLIGIWSAYVKNLPLLDENTHVVMAGISACTQINFTIHFLQLPAVMSRQFMLGIRAFALAILLASVYVLVTPFSYINSWSMSALGFLTECLILGLIFMRLKDRKYEAWIYLSSFLPLFFALAWLALSVLVGISRSGLFYQLAYAFPFVEVIMLGIGVSLKLIREREHSLVTIGQLQQQQAKAIIQTQDTERQRIAQDLHDDLGGTLATIRQRVADLEQRTTDPNARQTLAGLEPLMLKSGQDLRRIAHNLMPPELALIGLRGAVEQLVRAIPGQPTRFEFLVAGPERPLPPDVELNIYRIVSELVQNISKHAQARRASVQLLYQANHLAVQVEDDGIGIGANDLASGAGSFVSGRGIGLRNSKLRADYIGATLHRETGSGGTFVLLEVPYSTADDDTLTPQNSSRR